MLALGLLALLLVLAFVERSLYEERGDDQIRVTLAFAPERTARDAPSELLVRVEHVGRLPIPWVTCLLDLPPDLECAAADDRALTARLALPYRGGIVRHYPVTPRQRGLYRIEQLRVEFSDPLGLIVRRLDVRTRAELLCHPYPRDMDLTTPTRALMGEIERSALLEDPTAFRGVRPYLPGDPLRRIHWPQTARTGNLMAREYATAVDAHVYLCANLATHTPHWSGVDRIRLEQVIEATAGLAIEACRLALPVGLVVNGVAFEATPVTRLRPGASPQHLARLLDVLARLSAHPSEGPEALLRTLWTLPAEDTLVLVTGPLPDIWRRELGRLAGTRDVVLVVLAHGDEPPTALRGVRVVRIAVGDDALADKVVHGPEASA